MSRFKNDGPQELNFELHGRPYLVAPGAEVSIPPKLAFAIAKMGLPLTAVDSDEDEVAQAASDERPTEATALLWYGRAVEQRRLLIATQEQLTTAERRLDAADEEISRQSSELITANDALAKALLQVDSLATLTAERTALLARVATLEEAATAPASTDTTPAPIAPKGKGKAPPADVTP